MPRITVDLRLHKDSVWEPENLYLSLPFAKDGDTVYMDKAGAVFRPLGSNRIVPDTAFCCKAAAT